MTTPNSNRNSGAFWDTYNGPDNDSEFTFGPRSVYLEEMSKDGVSTMTDHHFGQVPPGLVPPSSSPSYRPESQGVLPDYTESQQQAYSQDVTSRRSMPPQRERRQPPPRVTQSQPAPSQSRQQSNSSYRDVQQDSSGSQHSNRSSSGRPQQTVERQSNHSNGYVVDEEEYRDEYIPENQPRGQQSSSSSQFVSRVADWYNEIEAQDVDGPDEEAGQRRSLVNQSPYSSQRTARVRNPPAPRRHIDSIREQELSPVTSPKDEIILQQNRKSPSRNCGLKFMLALICFIIILVGLGVAAVFVFFGNPDASSSSKDAPLTSPTTAPTTAATDGPTPGQLPLFLSQTLEGEANYGNTVAMDSDFLAIGTSTSKVLSFYKQDSTWNLIPTLVGDTGSGFGSAIDMLQPSNDPTSGYLLVGSPQGGTSNQGTATLYKFNETGVIWDQQGGALAGTPLSSTPEGFGTSVAMSENFFVIVGAPTSDTEATGAGRVYAFSYRPLDGMLQALPMVSGEKLLGMTQNGAFGTDVDITQDGTFFAAGAPGASRFSIYQWDGTLWLAVFEHSITSEPKFGSSVNFLSSKYVAVGSPETDSSRGSIYVFEKSDKDFTVWTALPPLRGKFRGDMIGTINTVSGQEGPNGPELVIGTGGGAVERYDLINNRWVRRFSDVSTATPVSAVVSVQSGDNYSVFAGYASAKKALVFSSTSVATTTTVPTTTTQTTTTTPSVPKTWQLSGGPFITSDSRQGYSTLFGSAVALVGDYLAVGEPNGQAGDLGDVVILQRSATWKNVDSGFAVGTLKFGGSVDGKMIGSTASILVGASETRDDGSLSASGAGFGSAHFYQLDSLGTWNAVGSEMRPAMLLQESGGEFGSSVAMASDVLRVVIGAPDSSVSTNALKTGRVYTFEYKNGDWQPMTSAIVGTGAQDRFGKSVAMSKDGSRMLVGSPGDNNGDGSVWYFSWNSTASEWKSIFSLRGGTGSNETLGTTVAILDDEGKRIAFGGPSWGGDRGRVEIFEESSMQAGFFMKVGNEDIAGAVGDRIGSTLCGAQGFLAFGTEQGSFRMYTFDSQNNRWSQVSTGPEVGSPVISISMAEDASAVAVGLEDQSVEVYDLV